MHFLIRKRGNRREPACKSQTAKMTAEKDMGQRPSIGCEAKRRARAGDAAGNEECADPPIKEAATRNLCRVNSVDTG
jgi:hypothetical protein